MNREGSLLANPTATDAREEYLALVRLKYRNRYADGSCSRPYLYEHIHSRGFDAVAIGLY